MGCKYCEVDEGLSPAEFEELLREFGSFDLWWFGPNHRGGDGTPGMTFGNGDYEVRVVDTEMALAEDSFVETNISVVFEIKNLNHLDYLLVPESEFFRLPGRITSFGDLYWEPVQKVKQSTKQIVVYEQL